MMLMRSFSFLQFCSSIPSKVFVSKSFFFHPLNLFLSVLNSFTHPPGSLPFFFAPPPTKSRYKLLLIASYYFFGAGIKPGAVLFFPSMARLFIMMDDSIPTGNSSHKIVLAKKKIVDIDWSLT